MFESMEGLSRRLKRLEAGETSAVSDEDREKWNAAATRAKVNEDEIAKLKALFSTLNVDKLLADIRELQVFSKTLVS